MTTEQRLGRLERENRWMRRIGVVVAALITAVLVLTGAFEPHGRVFVSLFGVERVLVAVAGFGSIYLGYTLFGATTA